MQALIKNFQHRRGATHQLHLTRIAISHLLKSTLVIMPVVSKQKILEDACKFNSDLIAAIKQLSKHN